MFYIASDHIGLRLKDMLIVFLRSKRVRCQDLGTSDDARVDYPVYAKILSGKVKRSKKSKGILICGTGIGMSIAANKIKNIRAAVCTNEYMAQISVQHNNANVLCLGSRIVGGELAKSIVDKFITSSFEGGRHKKRIRMLEKR